MNRFALLAPQLVLLAIHTHKYIQTCMHTHEGLHGRLKGSSFASPSLVDMMNMHVYSHLCLFRMTY